MPEPNLVSGDLVVDLAGLLRTSAVIAGAISSAVSLWTLNRSILWTAAAFVLGGIGGFILGSFTGPLVFPASPGYVFVVKLGPGAFWSALKASLIGGVMAGILAGLIPPLILSRVSLVARLIKINIIIGIAFAAIGAYISTSP